MRTRRLLRIGVAGVVAGLLAGLPVGCKRSPPPSRVAPGAPESSVPAGASSTDAAPLGQPNAAPSNRVPSNRAPSSPADTAERSDVDITNDVRRTLAGDPTLSAEARRVLATTSQGVVELSGTLATEAEKENIRIAVNKVAGVKGIDNRINVKK